MIVRLDFDLVVEADFVYTGRWPIRLMEEIGGHKVEIYEALAPNPLKPDMLTAQKVFTVEGRSFLVFCVADRQQSSGVSPEGQLLRVVWIDELPAGS